MATWRVGEKAMATEGLVAARETRATTKRIVKRVVEGARVLMRLEGSTRWRRRVDVNSNIRVVASVSTPRADSFLGERHPRLLLHARRLVLSLGRVLIEESEEDAKH